MHEWFTSPTLVPVAGCAVAIAAIGFGSWKRVRVHEMAHELRMKELELERLRMETAQRQGR